MNEFLYQIISLDLPPLLTASFSALTCALLGNFLVLRKLSLMGDAISHAVLPGIVVAFLVSGSRESLPVFLGAAAAGIITAVLIELIRRFGRVEEGASMGVVFSILFAAGVLLMEQAAARNVDLDAECLLHGQLETIFWSPPALWSEFLRLKTLRLLPSEVLASGSVFLIVVAFVVLLFKELTISAFDGDLATALGFRASLLHYLLMILVACAVVASFEAVGSILVIAMLICPAATARFYTDRLRTQISLSLLFALLAAVLGYVGGAFGPLWLGYSNSVNAAGLITVVSGTLFFVSAIFAPNYGVFVKFFRRIRFSLQVAEEDLLTNLYRLEERGEAVPLIRLVRRHGRGYIEQAALKRLVRSDSVLYARDTLKLTSAGRERAQQCLRSHRLWESYLVSEAGFEPSHVHQSAERLEHFTDVALARRLAESQSFPKEDPHGRKIPKEGNTLPSQDTDI